MKVIIVSEALPEPFEIDSEDGSIYGILSPSSTSYANAVYKKVGAIWEAEQMRKPQTRKKHSIFGRKDDDA